MRKVCLFLLATVVVAAYADVTCVVTNAATGLFVSGALCTLRSKTESLLYASGTTAANGQATLSYQLVAQEYLLRVTSPDFYVADDTFIASAGTNLTRYIPVSPLLNTTGIRAVLRWGVAPSDLDSHVFINGTGWGCNHVYFSGKTCLGQGATAPKVSLDVDDTYAASLHSLSYICVLIPYTAPLMDLRPSPCPV